MYAFIISYKIKIFSFLYLYLFILYFKAEAETKNFLKTTIAEYYTSSYDKSDVITLMWNYLMAQVFILFYE